MERCVENEEKLTSSRLREKILDVSDSLDAQFNQVGHRVQSSKKTYSTSSGKSSPVFESIPPRKDESHKDDEINENTNVFVMDDLPTGPTPHGQLQGLQNFYEIPPSFQTVEWLSIHVGTNELIESDKASETGDISSDDTISDDESSLDEITPNVLTVHNEKYLAENDKQLETTIESNASSASSATMMPMCLKKSVTRSHSEFMDDEEYVSEMGRSAFKRMMKSKGERAEDGSSQV